MNRPTDPGLFPIDKPVSDEAKEAARLHADWRDRFARVEKVERDYAAAGRAVRELLNAQEGAGRFGEQPVPLPSPSRRHLDQRRIARGEGAGRQLRNRRRTEHPPLALTVP